MWILYIEAEQVPNFTTNVELLNIGTNYSDNYQ